MKILNSVAEMIGKTPLVSLSIYKNEYKIDSNIFAKVEFANPAGSVKDRVALSMILDAERTGKLKAGGTVIEPTSGNTGIGICMVCAAFGYKAVIVMPDTMSDERKQLVKAYGAELVLTDGSLGMAGAVERAEELRAKIPNSIVAGQFENSANPAAHYNTTAPEIWADTDGKIDVFVAAIGTGGTVSGIGKYLKEKNPDVKVIGVEPASSPLITKGYTGKHNLQGAGANFIPKTLDLSVVDEVIAVCEEDAYKAGRELARLEGLLVGITSGAALHAAKSISEREGYSGKNIVVLLPDTGTRYLSTEMFN